ncbi:MAG: hypothetical protein H0U95_18570 [Bacteroidetes bacterium]|nr:hypothetical protein [Bacteroidota bacterium]
MKTIRQLIIITCLILICSHVKANSLSNSHQKNTITQKAHKGEINLLWASTSKDVLVIASTIEKQDLPAKGVSYLADLKFGSGTAINKSFVVYKGNESSIIVTGLQSGKEYYFTIYEADANGDYTIAGPSLNSLQGKYDMGKTILSLKTTLDKNNNYFIVERSDNSGNWKEIGKIVLSENSAKHGEYFFTDKGLLGGTYYYRIKQLLGNKYNYSLPIEVVGYELTNVFEIIAYPDIKSKTEFSVFSDMNTELSITDDIGTRVKSIVLNDKNGYQFSVKDLPAGMYAVSGSNSRGTITQKITLSK